MGRRARTTPCSADVMGSQGPTAVHLSWWAQRPGAQAVVHGAPEAFSKHGQAQLRRQDATSRPIPQLSPADFLASSPVVTTWMSCAESSGAPRTRSSLSRATPPHARYRARRQGAGSHRRAVASGARASAAAPPPPAAAAAAAAAASPGSAKNMSAPRGKIAPGRQSTPNEKPHALGRWGPKRPKLAQRTGTRTPGRVSAPLIGSTRWLFFGRAASRGAEMRATLQHCN